MTTRYPEDATHLLLDWSKGNKDALGKLVPLVYDELRRIASRYMLKEVELRFFGGLSVEETAEALQIPKETVKTRLLRARRRLQEELDPELRGALRDTFPFLGADCDALTERVLVKFLPAIKR